MHSSPASGGGAGKRGRSKSHSVRARKKQKRLDDLVDHLQVYSSTPPLGAAAAAADDASLRRSSRRRRAPVLLDASPLPSIRRRVHKPPHAARSSGTQKRKQVEEEKGKAPSLGIKEAVLSDLDGESGDCWRSRLRSRGGKVKGDGSSYSPVKEEVAEKSEAAFIEEEESPRMVANDETGSLGSPSSGSSKEEKEVYGDEDDQIVTLSSNDEEEIQKKPEDGTMEEEIKASSDPDIGSDPPMKELEAEHQREEAEEKVECMVLEPQNTEGTAVLVQQGEDVGPSDQAIDCPGETMEGTAVLVQQEEDDGPSDQAIYCPRESMEGTVALVQQEEDVGPSDQVIDCPGENISCQILESAVIAKEGKMNDTIGKPHTKEGRRCSLCGGGTDGRPPKKLVQEATDSDNEAYEGLSASEEPNYDVWDGFGDEPGWLGRLLGPIHDRFGIARVWVHLHCAVWSPEVYFAGLGCLKNVRAALCRGRPLKCSRCGRPGATIGCRVDRCPKTYHLPCSRADGCIFDHRKFLIACNDHRRLFQPQGNSYGEVIKKRKFKKLKSDLRKLSNEALRSDFEAEEKWWENCGEDEEFLKREGKRLHRDVLRIAPVYIGASSENKALYQGWESVAGLQDVVQGLKEVVILPLLYPEFFSNLGLTPPRGVLLHGYPGTGKTLVVRALIGACSRGDKRIAYFARKGADCLGKYVGDAERQLRLLFQVAEKSQPSIIFFDEIDGLAPARTRHQDQTHCSVVSTLLSLLDGLKSRGSVIVIGATNRPEAVDSALRRPGRFDREIYFPLPSVKDRSAILSLHTKKWPSPVSGPLLSWLASQTPGYAGADLQSLCTQAAMNGLKRNCALQEILASAEKSYRLSSLPSFVVEERDWLQALASAPPPCSRREAGMAANDVASSPLHAHLIGCLLQPLSQLLISLYIDERIWLSPPLSKACESLKNVIISSLEEKRIPVNLWWLHLHNLIQETYVANAIEKHLSQHGLLIGPSGSIPPPISHDCGGSSSSRAVQPFAYKGRNTSGFRALIAGAPRSGQQHLARCLLHGFMGHIEIQKIDLATIAQEGHGEVNRGLSQILLKCLNAGRCIIYMPRIDLWAISETTEQDVKMSSKTCTSSPRAGFHGATKLTSEAWNSFMEQVDSVCTTTSIIILATCEVPNHDLPVSIRQFFTLNVLNNTVSTASEHTIPRFFVQLDGKFEQDLVIDSSATKLSHDLVEHYVKLVHCRSHVLDKTASNIEPSSNVQSEGTDKKQTNAVLNAMHRERLASNSAASCRNSVPQQVVNNVRKWSAVSKLRSDQEFDIQFISNENSRPRFPPSKVVKGGPTLAIASFGYQVLRYPQFAELCWVTSKLNDGPCTDINGPWRGWPFNSCVIHTSSRYDNVGVSANSGNATSRECPGFVRGLIAVGLMAYRGMYTSVRDVSIEVRKVLELLVGQIRDKIISKKDARRYFRLLSQVAYLEDMVNSWAYTLQSLSIHNQVTTLIPEPEIVGRLCTENDATRSNVVDSHAGMLSASNKSSSEVQKVSREGSPQKSIASNGECATSGENISNLAVPDSAVTMTLVADQQEPFPPSRLQPSCPLAAVVPLSGDGADMSEAMLPCERMEHLKQVDSSGITEDPTQLDASLQKMNISGFDTYTCPREVNVNCEDMDLDPSSNNNGNNTDGLGVSHQFSRKNSSVLDSNVSCLYECCHGCLHSLHMLARKVLSDSCKSNGGCSTVDDIHDVLASCSLNLLALITKYYCFQSNVGSEICQNMEQIQRSLSEHCVCQDIGDDNLKAMSSRCKTVGYRFSAIQCSCHTANKEDAAAANSRHSMHLPELRFFFKGGVLMPSNPPEDSVFHCRFENLCLCSIVEMVFLSKQPAD